ncbi:MAG: ATP-binding protein [Muribaculaceae bacterium]|nr:ATP-binding protein [Muribaculaceae bacterium]
MGGSRIPKEEVCAGTTEEFIPRPVDLSGVIHDLSLYMEEYYGKKVIILLDEYDTPMQEAYVSGYWDEMLDFMRGLFNSTFKTNPALYRAVMTGITRVSRESIFSDLNNLEVVTTTSAKYATAFGFTEKEVFDALDMQGLSDRKEDVKRWYDGFTFGNVPDIYNPWSIINYLQKSVFAPYWANTSANSLAGALVREGDPEVKMAMENLLSGGTLVTELDEQVVFDQLRNDKNAIWSLLLAGGYLKIVNLVQDSWGDWHYELKLTNHEVQIMFSKMISGWFQSGAGGYNQFLRALLNGNLEEMNACMNQVALTTFSCFDTGSGSSGFREPERFYHGFVLGLMVELRTSYRITSNRESGFGRYDILLEPLEKDRDAIIIEFKVFNPKKESSLEDTVEAALCQIREKKYGAGLTAKGIAPERIRCYGFAFQGKTVLIGE